MHGHIEPGELMQEGEVPDIQRSADPTRNFGAHGDFTHNTMAPHGD
jgi:hypothetical protein